MNGRIYDPVIGRFMSPDAYIQDPYNLQSYNRYSYTINNPLAYTDPSGHFWGWIVAAIIGAEVAQQVGIIDKGTARAIQGIAVAVAIGSPQGFAASIGGAGALSTTMVAGFAGGFVGSNFSVEGGIYGAASAGLFYGVGEFVPGGAGTFGKVVGHAAAGCASAAISGGNCGQGALAAGFSQAMLGGRNFGSVEANMVARAVVGGTASVLGGGKFANGAVTAAFGHLFNDMQHEMSPDGSFRSDGDTGYPQTSAEWWDHTKEFASQGVPGGAAAGGVRGGGGGPGWGVGG